MSRIHRASASLALLVGASSCGAYADDDHGLTRRSDEPTGEVAEALSSVATPCAGSNFTNTLFHDPTAMGGPLAGIRWIPSGYSTIAYLEVFTGEKVGPNQLAIWSDDGAPVSRPLAPIAYTQVFTSSKVNGWQGAALNAPVSVAAGTTYWIVWDPSGGEQASATLDPADLQQPYWGSFTGSVTGGASWIGPFSALRWKFRAFCGSCTTVQRGSGGSVADSLISQPNALVNYGSSSTLFAGTVGVGARHSLVSFDTGVVPPAGVVNLAKMRLRAGVLSNGTLNVHQVTAPWNEATVTWSSFAGAYDPVPFTSSPPPGPSYNGPLLFDITGLGASWVQGTLPNDGVLVAQPSGVTAIAASEVGPLALRPALDLCWDTPPPPSCPLSGRPFANTLCGASVPCTLHADEAIAPPSVNGLEIGLAIDESCSVHVVFQQDYWPTTGFHGVRTGPGAWTITTTPFLQQASAAEPMGGTGIYAFTRAGIFDIEAWAWDGTTWSFLSTSPAQGEVHPAGTVQASAGGAVHLAIFPPYGSGPLLHQTFQGPWTANAFSDTVNHLPAIALSPQDDAHFLFWQGVSGAPPGVIDLRWRTSTTGSELVASIATTDFKTYLTGFAITSADSQNPEGKPHAFYVITSGGMDQLYYATRVGPASWTSQLVEQAASTNACFAVVPSFGGQTCSYAHDSLDPLTAVSTASGSVRMLYTVSHFAGTFTSECDILQDGCYWYTDVSSITASALRMAIVEPAQPLAITTIPGVFAWSPPWGGGATGRVDNKGGIHLALQDGSTSPWDLTFPRYIHLGF